jgi:endonuclease/exonuclease/phosphatase family metal-dependent hydrolase
MRLTNFMITYAFVLSIDTLILESTETAFIITGDFNPNSNNFRSRHMELQCGLKQVVHVPTRNEHILDLILTNTSNYYNVPTAYHTSAP